MDTGNTQNLSAIWDSNIIEMTDARDIGSSNPCRIQYGVEHDNNSDTYVVVKRVQTQGDFT